MARVSIGETFGNFRLVSRLGRGGMGEVFLAEQQSIGTRVAVKVLQAEISEDKDHVQRFFNEARAVSRIQHAGIVKIFDVGFHPQTGQAYLIMEYLEGESLGRRIRRAPLSLAQVVDVGRQIASVLEATHAAGITHRDLKPDNIYLVPDRELASKERVKVLDFGIAKLSGTLAGASPRTVGTLGTPAYMAPEQWGDSSKVDWRADLYALGCVTFEMVTGRPPFEAKTFAEACAAHLTLPPPRASTIVPGVPEALENLLARLLAKDPSERPASLHEVVASFDAIGHGNPIASGLPQDRGPDAATLATTSGTPDPIAKRPIALFVIGGVVGLAAIGGAAAYFLRDDEDPPREEVVTIVAPDAAPVIVPDASASAQTLAHAAAVLAENRDRLIACYTKATLREGKQQITVEVDERGEVENVSFGEPSKATPCLDVAVRSIAFGPAEAKFSTSYAFEFKQPRRVAPVPDPISTGPVDPPITDAQYQRSVRDVMDRARPVLSACAVPNAAPTVVSLTIDENGAVLAAFIGGSAPAGMQRCLKDRVKRMTLPPPPRGRITIVVPLLREPKR